MAKCCSVRGCIPNHDVTYFMLPTSRNLRRKWLEAINVKRLNPEAMVCSAHFTPSDFSEVRGKLRLNGKVVPSVFDTQESPALSPHRTEETEHYSKHIETIESSMPEKQTDSYKNTLNRENVITENENHENGDRNNDDNCDGHKKNDDSFASDKKVDDECSNGKNNFDCDINNDTGRDGGGNNDTDQDGDINNDTKSHGCVNNDIHQDGDKNTDSKRDGGVKNDTDQDGNTNNDIKRDGGVNNDSDQVGDVNNDVKLDEDINNDEVSNKNNVKPDSFSTYRNNLSDGDSNNDNTSNSNNEDTTSYTNNEDSTSNTNNGETTSTSINEDTTSTSINEDELINDKSNVKNEIEEIDVNTMEKDLRTRKKGKKIRLIERDRKSDAKICSERLPPSSIDISKPTDIEEVLVNFCIPTGGRRDALSCDVTALDLTEAGVEEEPRFIEVEVDRRDSEDRGDCLMLLESVQCEVDPSSLMMEDLDLEQDSPTACRKDNAISLLTSSDEDDVILEEPHIDTVEVSDETDEDDVPLVKLVKPADKVQFKDGVRWSVYDYDCPHCMFSTNNSNEYKRHRKIHENEDGVKRKRTHIFHVCEVCSYATSSKTQLVKHQRTHKDERRFKCRYCEYAAKHRMSLVYHMKNHEGAKIYIDKGRVKSVKKGVKCKNCGIRMPKESAARHKGNCKLKTRHCCQFCDYETKRPSDLKRHKRRKHPDECDDEDYLPEN